MKKLIESKDELERMRELVEITEKELNTRKELSANDLNCLITICKRLIYHIENTNKF